MPLFIKADGEGIRIDPARRRPEGARRAARDLKRMRMYCIWLDYRRKGLSAADIAELTSKPLSTVKYGLAEARRYLVEMGYELEGSYVEPLEPFFGQSAGTAGPDPDPLDCPNCGGSVRFDTLICGVCHTVSPRNQIRLDRQLARGVVRQTSKAISRLKTAAPDELETCRRAVRRTLAEARREPLYALTEHA